MEEKEGELLPGPTTGWPSESDCTGKRGGRRKKETERKKGGGKGEGRDIETPKERNRKKKETSSDECEY